MATTKERLDELEVSLGLVQDELQKMNTGIADKFQNFESSLNKTLEEGMNRMMALVTQSRDGGSSGALGNRRPLGTPQTNHGGDNTNLLAPAPAPRRHVKLDFPRFKGGDPTEWISKAKQYFAYQEIPREQQVSFASYHLTEEANEWWQAISKALDIDPYDTTWEIFEEELWVRFGPTEGENFHEALSKIHQTGSLREYQREFERLMNKVNNWKEEALVGTFLGGLNDSIVDAVRMFSPKTLKEVINLSRLRDEQLQKQKQTRIIPSRNYSFASSSRTPNQEPQQQIPKKLSWDKMKRKRSLGLCFSCDERYTPGHQCRTSQLLLMEGLDAEEEDHDEVQNQNGEKPKISFYAMTGWSAPETLRIYAIVNKQNVIALVDSGSTHNFISDKAANRLNLEITQTKPFAVRVADGSPLQCHGHCKDVRVKMGEVTMSLKLNILPLVGLDLVLGIQWLQSLGSTICNWKEQTMEFDWEGKRCTLRGISNSKIQQVDAREFAKEARQGHSLFVVYVANEDAKPLPRQDDNNLNQQLRLCSPYSFMNLEDKVLLKEGSNDGALI